MTAVADWIRGHVGLSGEGIYNINTSNEAVDFGAAVSYNATFGYRLFRVVYESYPSPRLNAYLGTQLATSWTGSFGLRVLLF